MKHWDRPIKNAHHMMAYGDIQKTLQLMTERLQALSKMVSEREVATEVAREFETYFIPKSLEMFNAALRLDMRLEAQQLKETGR